MRFKIPLLFSIISSFLILSGCSGKVNNSVTIQNLSAGTVYFNFRGNVITALTGATASVSEIPKGTYLYSTTYNVPAEALSSASQGDVKGTLTIAAGTRIMIIYSSTLISGAYILYASVSSSDSQTTTTSP
jgi:hypothetical protein